MDAFHVISLDRMQSLGLELNNLPQIRDCVHFAFHQITYH